MSEQERLNFIEERDGHEAMLKFAEQGLALYVEQSIKHGKFKENIEEYVKVLKENGLEVQIVLVKLNSKK